MPDKRNGVTRQCQQCGAAFYIPACRMRPNQGRFCSIACHGLSRVGTTSRRPRQLIPHPTDATALLVPLTRGHVAVIDADDADLAGDRAWFARHSRGGIYAANKMPGEMVYLHRMLLGVTDRAVQVDHADGDTLNNRRSNLRLATPRDNSCNSRKRIGRTGFRGVWKHERGRYYAVLDRKYVAVCDTAEEAARAWDKAARALYGEFARLNFPDE